MSEPNIKDGIYVELFVVKDGQRYNVKTLSMNEVTKVLVNGLMDGVERLFGEDETNNK